MLVLVLWLSGRRHRARVLTPEPEFKASQALLSPRPWQDPSTPCEVPLPHMLRKCSMLEPYGPTRPATQARALFFFKFIHSIYLFEG